MVNTNSPVDGVYAAADGAKAVAHSVGRNADNLYAKGRRARELQEEKRRGQKNEERTKKMLEERRKQVDEEYERERQAEIDADNLLKWQQTEKDKAAAAAANEQAEAAYAAAQRKAAAAVAAGHDPYRPPGAPRLQQPIGQQIGYHVPSASENTGGITSYLGFGGKKSKRKSKKKRRKRTKKRRKRRR